MKNYRWMLVLVVGAGLLSSMSLASHVLRARVQTVLPDVLANGDLACQTSMGKARVRVNTRNGRGIVRLRGRVMNASGRTQRYRRSALFNSCVRQVVEGLVSDLVGTPTVIGRLRGHYRVSRRGRARGIGFGIGMPALPAA